MAQTKPVWFETRVIYNMGSQGYYTGTKGQFRGIAFAEHYPNEFAARGAIMDNDFGEGWFRIDTIIVKKLV